MEKTRVLVIDDSAYNRRALAEMLEKSSGIEVVGTATDGEQGLKKALMLKPDVITLDLEMPVMDGFTFLRLLMVKMPTPVIVISARDDDANVFKALELGAVDFMSKPTARISKELMNIENDLISKVEVMSNLSMDNVTKRMEAHVDTAPLKKHDIKDVEKRKEKFEVVAIGSSTGGPPALQSLFTSLPPGFPLSIVVSQHMPPGFTRAFSERLNRLLPFDVKEAQSGDKVMKGRILIAPGGYHMTFKKDNDGVKAEIAKRGDNDIYAPSVDKMFSSVAKVFEEKAIGIVLTGMGNDGKNGVKKMKKSNGYIIAESEETAIVYGMPREAVKAGAVDKVLPLNEISSQVCNLSDF
jgi:two-component system chemotaxis response regulator CheB